MWCEDYLDEFARFGASRGRVECVEVLVPIQPPPRSRRKPLTRLVGRPLGPITEKGDTDGP